MCVLRDSVTVCVLRDSETVCVLRDSETVCVLRVSVLLCCGHVIYFYQMPPGGAVTYTLTQSQMFYQLFFLHLAAVTEFLLFWIMCLFSSDFYYRTVLILVGKYEALLSIKLSMSVIGHTQ